MSNKSTKLLTKSTSRSASRGHLSIRRHRKKIQQNLNQGPPLDPQDKYSAKVILGAMNSRKRKQIEIEARSNQRNIQKFSRIAFEKLGRAEN